VICKPIVPAILYKRILDVLAKSSGAQRKPAVGNAEKKPRKTVSTLGNLAQQPCETDDCVADDENPMPDGFDEDDDVVFLL